MSKFHHTHSHNGCCGERPTMMMLNEVSKLFHDKLRSLNEQMGIPDGYRHILFTLKWGDGMTQCEISQHTHHKAPTVSVALQKMEADGLVIRVADEDDLRQSRIYITDKGREITEKYHANLVKTEEMALDGLTKEEEEQLRAVLARMRDIFLNNEE